MAKKQSKPRKKAAPKVMKERLTIKVERCDAGIVKTALTDEGREEIAREARFLAELAGTGVAPQLIEQTDSQLVVEDLGDGKVSQVPEVQHGANFVTNSIMLLNELRAHGIRHGDLTSRNLIVRNDFPIAIDFGQSTFVDEGGPYKRPKSDAYYLWQAVHALVPDQRYVVRWQAIRTVLGGDEDGAWDFLAGRSVTDLGCWDGDMLAMAVAEGAEGVGVDIREAALAVAIERWSRFGCQFIHGGGVMGNFGKYVKGEPVKIGYLPEDIAFLFNATWAWIVQRDEGLARAFLDKAIERSNVLFFETELWGDGPGASFLRTQDDIGELLSGPGRTVKKLATYAVGGRDAERCVWSVE